ncbi:MAG: NYN domain-containing protein [Thermodesulfovibrionia bacterium]|nr:NYN domain-containing protein [Thermodesulfovibrionia bacterium]
MASPKTIIFADGENLVMRYQAMIAAGAKPHKKIHHIPDSFVWHPDITTWSCFELIRVWYYTSVIGDINKIQDIENQIGNIDYDYHYDPDSTIPKATAQIVPRVYKKSSKSQKTRNVDINIIIDVMRHSYSRDIDLIYILSGDGDYLPLINEAMKQGKRVFVSAFSSGLNKQLSYSVDTFTLLDELFFKNT